MAAGGKCKVLGTTTILELYFLARAAASNSPAHAVAFAASLRYVSNASLCVGSNGDYSPKGPWHAWIPGAGRLHIGGQQESEVKNGLNI